MLIAEAFILLKSTWHFMYSHVQIRQLDICNQFTIEPLRINSILAWRNDEDPEILNMVWIN